MTINIPPSQRQRIASRFRVMIRTIRLTFKPISEDDYLWAVRKTGDSLHKRGPYELGWEPWSTLPDGTETYNVYRRVGASCSCSIQAVTFAEFLALPVPFIPAPIIDPDAEGQTFVRMQFVIKRLARHINASKTEGDTPVIDTTRDVFLEMASDAFDSLISELVTEYSDQ
jgi:hypothetical protein